MIRPAKEADLAVLAAVGRRTYVEHFADRWHGYDLEAWLDSQFGGPVLSEELKSPDITYDLAFVDGVAVGFAKTIRDQPVESAPHLRGRLLQKIYFDAPMAGRGLGTALVREIIGRAERAGEPRVWLDVVKENTRARALYERLGFLVVGESNGSMIANPTLDFWVMTRDAAC
jgi:diamine N-acetyltransferase